MTCRTSIFCLFIAIFYGLEQTTHAAPINVANGKSVIGGSGEYSGNYNAGSAYGTQNLTDGQNASPDNNTGSITEPGQDGSYWLGTNAATTGYFVIDLGQAFPIRYFELFNTRNGPYDDRGTGNFTITGSNTITNVSVALGDDIVGGTLLASGTLTSQTYPGAFNTQGSTPLVPDTFASLDTTTAYRYLRFDALSIGALDDKGSFGQNGVGLNEFRAIPEPSSFALLIIGCAGLTLRRRR